jgi:glutamyl-tRNA synthetase
MASAINLFSRNTPMALSLDEIIRKYSLKNAHDYKLAIPAKVVGKVIGEFPEAKKDMAATMKLLNEEAKRVNSLTFEQVEKELLEFEFAEKKEEKKEISLPGAVQGRVLTRFPPEPSGYPHIGHAKAAWLDCQSALNYGGKMVLRWVGAALTEHSRGFRRVHQVR